MNTISEQKKNRRYLWAGRDGEWTDGPTHGDRVAGFVMLLRHCPSIAPSLLAAELEADELHALAGDLADLCDPLDGPVPGVSLVAAARTYLRLREAMADSPQHAGKPALRDALAEMQERWQSAERSGKRMRQERDHYRAELTTMAEQAENAGNNAAGLNREIVRLNGELVSNHERAEKIITSRDQQIGELHTEIDRLCAGMSELEAERDHERSITDMGLMMERGKTARARRDLPADTLSRLVAALEQCGSYVDRQRETAMREVLGR